VTANNEAAGSSKTSVPTYKITRCLTSENYKRRWHNYPKLFVGNDSKAHIQFCASSVRELKRFQLITRNNICCISLPKHTQNESAIIWTEPEAVEILHLSVWVSDCVACLSPSRRFKRGLWKDIRKWDTIMRRMQKNIKNENRGQLYLDGTLSMSH
jgi:hypothetical protein